MSWTWYNVKELGVARQTADAKGVTTGPTYRRLVNWDKAKKIGVNMNAEQITASGNGIPYDPQTALATVEIAVESQLLTPEVEAEIYGEAHIEDPNRSRLIFHEDSGGKIVGLWARTDKVGTNGEDVVLWIPAAQFASRNKDTSENAHRTISYGGQAGFTKSSIQWEEINETTGILETVTKRFIAVEDNNRVSSSIFAEETGFLTVSTSFPISSHVVGDNIVIKFNRSLKRASINKSTVLFKQGSTPVAFALSVSTDTLTDDTLTINPTPALTAATAYTITLKEALQDVDGNHLEEDTALVVNTAA